MHALPSSHGSELNTFEQPVIGWHESVVQRLLSLQFSGVPGVQIPTWHVSNPVHTLLSLQSALMVQFVQEGIGVP